jgi:hypothetical protein
MESIVDQALNHAKRRRRLRIVAILCALIALAGSVWTLSTTHSRGVQYGSREQIIQSLFEATPRGVSREIVQQFIESNGWHRGGRIAPYENPKDRIGAYLGEAGGLVVPERVYAEWLVDAEEKLVDIDVYKITLVP